MMSKNPAQQVKLIDLLCVVIRFFASGFQLWNAFSYYINKFYWFLSENATKRDGTTSNVYSFWCFPPFYLKENAFFFSFGTTHIHTHTHIIAISAAFGAFYTFPVYRTNIKRTLVHTAPKCVSSNHNNLIWVVSVSDKRFKYDMRMCLQ